LHITPSEHGFKNLNAKAQRREEIKGNRTKNRISKIAFGGRIK
jgi:hypothetical protein